MKLIGLAGWSGSGKTHLIARLVPALIARGVRVSTIKHAHHAFEVDKPGKDSWIHREAGATEVLISSSARMALLREHRDGEEPGLDVLLQRLAPVDLVLVEGFKRGTHTKIEVWREETGKPFLHPDDPTIVAIAAPAAPPGATVPWIDLDDTDKIADFILTLPLATVG
ncbi:molybdopterin-guanine dinucleotide biosynthesis protein B [Roseiterribacter gracilis]|uniref:Molybdopterin-guanine dinucleotide biosynthesis protein B n=1 Tax=Roseiterribacter gracilis TaxID=2812848 RepID=A0A8S8XIA1_9PROT|nr:molybdopterin-guanine dinucleotide biosynthesis protein B [Rhodospirillales bacterium TMPK1]